MRRTYSQVVAIGALCLLASSQLAGCGSAKIHQSSRMHLTNGSDTPVQFLAIEDSEFAVAGATNRLTKPIPPNTIYSAVLPRPGNYWVRTETRSGDAIVRRVEGPVRIERGVSTWQFKREDGVPLYRNGVDRSLALVAISR
jgi:hypothetical protein